MPHLITRLQVAASVKDRFAQQYGPDFHSYPFGNSAQIHKQLVMLGDSPSVESIEAMMPGWTRLTCDDCGQDAEAVVQVGQEPDFESSTAALCRACAAMAYKLFETLPNS